MAVSLCRAGGLACKRRRTMASKAKRCEQCARLQIGSAQGAAMAGKSPQPAACKEPARKVLAGGQAVIQLAFFLLLFINLQLLALPPCALFQSSTAAMRKVARAACNLVGAVAPACYPLQCLDVRRQGTRAWKALHIVQEFTPGYLL